MKKLSIITAILALEASVSAAPYLVNLSGVASNSTFFPIPSDSSTNKFTAIGFTPVAGDVSGEAYQCNRTFYKVTSQSDIRIFTNNTSIMFFCDNSTNYGTGGDLVGTRFFFTDSTNGTPDNWTISEFKCDVSPPLPGNWYVQSLPISTVPQPLHSAFGAFSYGASGDGGGLTNLNAGVVKGYTNTLDKVNDAAGTLFPQRVSYPTNIVQANGRAIAYVAGGNVVTSTNNAFAGIWPHTQIQCTNGLQLEIYAISNANNAIVVQMGSGPIVQKISTSMGYSTNWNFNTPFELSTDNGGNFPGGRDQNGGFRQNVNAGGYMTIFDCTPTTLPRSSYYGLIAEGSTPFPVSNGKYAWMLGSSGPTWESPNIVCIDLLASPNALLIGTNSVVIATFGFATPQTLLATNGVSGLRSNLLAWTSFTFPNSTVNWTNPLQCSIMVKIDNTGVTGTALKINGTQVTASIVGDETVPLQANEYFSETFTVGTPTGKYHPFP